MATKTFSNAHLATLWAKALKDGGTRRDVVTGLMAELGVTNTKDAYRKCYNNVIQRVKNLEQGTPPVVFPDLTKGKKGARKTAADVAAIQAILMGNTTEAPAPAPEAEAPAPQAG